jgi:DNA-binding MarR family transcriptional regulator
MTGLEAIPVIDGLIAQLIKLRKDGKTQILVQQIQSHQLVIHKDLVETYAKMAKMDADHAQAIAAIREGHGFEIGQLNAKIRELEAQLSPSAANGLTVEIVRLLQLFFAHGNTDFSSQQIAHHLQISGSLADYYIDELLRREFIRQSVCAFDDEDIRGARPAAYRIDTAGRAYIVKTGIAK